LQELVQYERDRRRVGGELIDVDLPDDEGMDPDVEANFSDEVELPPLAVGGNNEGLQALRKELIQIRDLLSEMH
jgi:hypothetical protein